MAQIWNHTAAFLDNASNTSFCSEGLIEELGIEGVKQRQHQVLSS